MLRCYANTNYGWSTAGQRYRLNVRTADHISTLIYILVGYPINFPFSQLHLMFSKNIFIFDKYLLRLVSIIQFDYHILSTIVRIISVLFCRSVTNVFLLPIIHRLSINNTMVTYRPCVPGCSVMLLKHVSL